MKILKQHPIKIYGNDCMIYRTIALLESNEEYLVIVHERFTGWCADTDCKIKKFALYENALKCYEDYVNYMV